MVRKTARALSARRPLHWWFLLPLLGAALLGVRPAPAQELSAQELEDLVAPVALYPDDVLGVVLPASTFPLDVVRAARFLEDREDDPSLQPDPEWDDSIVALLNYPEVLRMMDENIDWTWELGEAVLTDQAEVLEAAQDFRSRALAAGNLQSDDRQTVASDNGAITIVPADPQVIYVPVYEPREVVVYHPAPIWRYYPVAYPVYYYPYPYGYSFNVGFFWGVTSYFSIGWHSHYVHVHHHTHYGHPYYLNSYYSYTPYYPRNHVNLTVVVNDHDHVWVPGPRRGGRPEMVSVEGRASAARMTRTATVEGQAAAASRVSTSRMAAAESSSTRGSATSTRSSATSTRSAAPSTRGTSPSTSGAAPSTRSAAPSTGNAASPARSSEGNDSRARMSAANPTSTRQSSTTSGSTSPTRMAAPSSTRSAPQASTRSVPQTSARSAPQTSARPAPQTSTRSAPQASTRTAPQASTTRTAPQSSSRPAPQTSTRSAPPSSAQRSMSSGQTQGTTRSGGGAGSSSSRQSLR